MSKDLSLDVKLENALQLLSAGEYANCIAELQQLLPECENDAFFKALIQDGLGRAWMLSGEPAKAMEAFDASLQLLRRLFSEKKISADYLQGALQNQAHACFLLEDYAQAEKIAKEAVNLAEKTWGPNSKQTAQALFHFSAPFYSTRKFEFAEKLLQRALGILEQTPGGPHELGGTILNNLGRIYEEKGETEKGIEYHRKAVELRRQLPDKSDLAFSLGNYGIALGMAGQPEDAVRALEECLAIYASLGKGESPEAKAYAANLDILKKLCHGNGHQASGD